MTPAAQPKTAHGWTVDELAVVWQHWRAGRSVAELARTLEVPYVKMWVLIEQHGGIAPRRRRRNARHLSLAQREHISRGLCLGWSIRAVATDLDRPPSTISREVARNGGRERYRAVAADQNAWDCARRPKAWKLMIRRRLYDAVVEKLKLEWSPQQISGWLRHRYPQRASMQVSHETIYRTLFVQTRGDLRSELTNHLRRGRIHRRARLARNNPSLGPIVDGVSISDRPAEANDRAVPGHWEGDLLLGDRDSFIATLVERKSRFVMLLKLRSRDSKTVVKALARHVQKLPAELKRSLTWDRGAELARHKDFKLATNVQVYFCDPHSPWQRGSNENTNGLLRQYFPKGHPLGGFSQRLLDRVAARLNGRPRKTLDYKTPAEVLSHALH